MFFFRRRKRTKKSTAGNSCGKYLGSAYNELTQRTKPIHSPAVAHRIAAVSHRNALKVEKEREVGLSLSLIHIYALPVTPSFGHQEKPSEADSYSVFMLVTTIT